MFKRNRQLFFFNFWPPVDDKPFTLLPHEPLWVETSIRFISNMRLICCQSSSPLLLPSPSIFICLSLCPSLRASDTPPGRTCLGRQSTQSCLPEAQGGVTLRNTAVKKRESCLNRMTCSGIIPVYLKTHK